MPVPPEGSSPTPDFQKYVAAGYGAELLPIAPPNAVASVTSSAMKKGAGKLPAVFYADRGAAGEWTGYPNWSEIKVDAELITYWSTWPTRNIGLRTKFFPAIDIDVADEWMATMIADACRKRIGDAPVRGRQGSSRRLMVYRTPDGIKPLRKARIEFTLPTSDEKHAVELLGDGQQFVLEGNHPKGGVYVWTDGCLADWAPPDLKPMSADGWLALADDVMALIEMMGGAVTQATALGNSGDNARQSVVGLQVTPEQKKAYADALNHIPDGELSYDDWISVLAAVKGSVGNDLGFFNEVVAPWCEGHPLTTYDYALVRWDSLVEVSSGPANLFLWAKKFGYAAAGAGLQFQPVGRDGAPLNAGDVNCGAGSDAGDAGDDGDDLNYDDQDRGAADAEDDGPLPDRRYSAKALELDFLLDNRNRLRYCTDEGCFYVERGGIWVRDPHKDLAMELAIDFVFSIGATLHGRGGRENRRMAEKVDSPNMAEAILKCVKSDPLVRVRTDDFDKDDWLLNTPGGVVDLHTMKTRPASPDDLMTLRANVTPVFSKPKRWLKFLSDTFNGDKECIEYVQKIAGLALTGDTSQECVFFGHGEGGTGKGTFTETLLYCMGDYGKIADVNLFVEGKNGEGHPTGLAGLVGKRFVVVPELPKNRRWNEHLLKTVTGGDTVTARFMRGDFFDYKPKFKLLLTGNDQPSIVSPDWSMRRRLRIIPFTNSFRDRQDQMNTDLKRLLKEEEGAQILAWAIEGCVKWALLGLGAPQVVTEATQAYVDEQDTMQQWLDERCVVGGEQFVLAADAYADYSVWRERRGEVKLSMKMFGADMTKKKVRKGKHPSPADRRVIYFMVLRTEGSRFEVLAGGVETIDETV